MGGFLLQGGSENVTPDLPMKIEAKALHTVSN